MNTVILSCLLVLSLFSLCSSLQAPDVPVSGGLRTPNMTYFDSGALIIDMGIYQVEDTTVMTQVVPSYYTSISFGYKCGYASVTQYVNSSTAGLFNLYTYGLVVRLLHANIPVYWIIASNKQQSDNDIPLVNSQRIHPYREPSGSVNWGGKLNTAGQYAFQNGPFVIRAADATNALAVLNTVKQSYTNTGRFESIVIYQTLAPMTIDVRHKMTFHPFAFVSTLAGPWCAWSANAMVLMNAGLVQGLHFQLITTSTDVQNFDENTCGTIFMEPHYTFDDSGCAGCGDTPSYYVPLTKFIKSGGNFWVQCAGIGSYENSLWNSMFLPSGLPSQAGAFISKYGIQALGNRAFNQTDDRNITFVDNRWQGGINEQTLNYLTPDIPIAQFNGALMNRTGYVMSFYLRNDPAPTIKNDSLLWINSGYGIVSHPTTDKNTWQSYAQQQQKSGNCWGCCQGYNYCPYANTASGDVGRPAYAAAGSRFGSNSGTLKGGNVWYLGTHTVYFDGTKNPNSNYPSGFPESNELYNGRRMLLNAVITPAVRPTNCSQNFCSQDVDCTSQYNNPCYQCRSAVCFNTAPVAGSCPSGIVDYSTCSCSSTSPSVTRSLSSSTSRSFSTSLSSSVSRSLSSTGSLSLSSTGSLSLSSTRSISLSSTGSLSLSSTGSFSLSSTRSISLSSTGSLSLSSTGSISFSSTGSISTSATVSKSSGASISSTATISVTSTMSTSLSSTGSLSLSSTRSISLSPTGSISTTTTASKSTGASISSTASISVTSTMSTSLSSTGSISLSSSVTSSPSSSESSLPSQSQSPSSSPSSSSSSSPSPSSSSSPGVVVAAGDGSHTGAIAGGVVGGVVGLAGLAAVGAAAAGIAAVAYKRKQAVPLSGGALMDVSSAPTVVNNASYEPGVGGQVDNPLYHQP